jgi:hypothetical protein
VAEITVRVQCKAKGRDLPPVRFQLGNRDLFVEEILDQWWGDDATFYKVRADDENRYILKHRAAGSRWTLDSLAPQKVLSAGHRF